MPDSASPPRGRNRPRGLARRRTTDPAAASTADRSQGATRRGAARRPAVSVVDRQVAVRSDPAVHTASRAGVAGSGVAGAKSERFSPGCCHSLAKAQIRELATGEYAPLPVPIRLPRCWPENWRRSSTFPCQSTAAPWRQGKALARSTIWRGPPGQGCPSGVLLAEGQRVDGSEVGGRRPSARMAD